MRLIITMNSSNEILSGDVWIEGNRITYMGPGLDREADKVIDAGGKVLLPGFVQTHIHLCQTLFRGRADDLELIDWLKHKIWPLEAAHDEESVYYSGLEVKNVKVKGKVAMVDVKLPEGEGIGEAFSYPKAVIRFDKKPLLVRVNFE